MKFAIIETGGKQYRVETGEVLRVEKLDITEGGSVIFDKVLLKVDDDRVQVGHPYLEGVLVAGTVTAQARERKKIVFKYHSKTRQRKKRGHRQPYTEVNIDKVS